MPQRGHGGSGQDPRGSTKSGHSCSQGPQETPAARGDWLLVSKQDRVMCPGRNPKEGVLFGGKQKKDLGGSLGEEECVMKVNKGVEE